MTFPGEHCVRRRSDHLNQGPGLNLVYNNGARQVLLPPKEKASAELAHATSGKDHADEHQKCGHDQAGRALVDARHRSLPTRYRVARDERPPFGPPRQ